MAREGARLKSPRARFLLPVCCPRMQPATGVAPEPPSDLRFYGGAGWTRTSDQRIMSPPFSV